MGRPYGGWATLSVFLRRGYLRQRELGSVFEAVGDERYRAVVWGPGIDVDRALATEQLRDGFRFAAAGRGEAQLDVFVGGMIAGGDVILAVGYVDNPRAVGGDVREPAVGFLDDHMGRVGAVGFHAPDL